MHWKAHLFWHFRLFQTFSHRGSHTPALWMLHMLTVQVKAFISAQILQFVKQPLYATTLSWAQLEFWRILCVRTFRCSLDGHTVYAIIFAYRYFHCFGLGLEICEGLISRFSDIFITINGHRLKWIFLRGLTRDICENETTAKITTYTVFELGTVWAIDPRMCSLARWTRTIHIRCHIVCE